MPLGNFVDVQKLNQVMAITYINFKDFSKWHMIKL